MNNIMLDLEKMSEGSDAAILSITAVFFEPSTGELGDVFTQSIIPENSAIYGEVDTSQSELHEKLSELNCVDGKLASGLVHALNRFSDWVNGTAISGVDTAAAGDPKIRIWAYGASGDNAILRHAYKACNKAFVSQPHTDRDVQTMIDLGRSLRGITTRAFKGDFLDNVDVAKFEARYDFHHVEMLKQARGLDNRLMIRVSPKYSISRKGSDFQSHRHVISVERLNPLGDVCICATKTYPSIKSICSSLTAAGEDGLEVAIALEKLIDESIKEFASLGAFLGANE